MSTEIIEIEVYDKREKSWTKLIVEKISENTFRMIDNDIFNCNLKLGTEFNTKINKEGKHEIIEITKKSTFITRRFFLTPDFTVKDYELLGDEIIKQGGFWQVDFGSLATVNLPENSELDLDDIFRIFDFKPIEITE